ncbi:uncharacterized protein PV09_01616 [Verruconis gallopava]|uniref:DUF2406 domain-containing protein n=1 Tax=Verruconis gallopava TaxID=253628 RepID=A0A0D1XXZ4_9PEZI|nr:uncharacterized protein PV09_01616 [Verruconis gallopava]KIW07676.1 hypothetical protein PV09_01616 [Verruconis gallopava]
MATMTQSPSKGAAAAGGADHHQRLSMRPRSKSAFSVTSDNSHNSRRSGDKEKLKESHDEKKKLAFSNTTKANPNAAINEMQPVAQQLEKATIGSLRASQYFDMNGVPITDPDYSNPTRRRTERPLETIMSFEAAIDREYKRQRDAAREAARQSYYENGGGQDSGSESRRSSYWGGGEYAGNGYYNHPQSRRNGYFDNPPSRNKFTARMYSDQGVQRYNYGNNGYPYSTPGYGQTRDTVNTGGSNGSASDQWHNSTDPSSDNSSIERMRGEHGESYGYPTPQREPISEDGHYTYTNGPGYNSAYMNGGNSGPGGSNGYFGQQYNNGAPAPPPKVTQGGPVQPPARQPIKLDNSTRPDIIPGGTRTPAPEKRKSWLKRRFSKN